MDLKMYKKSQKIYRKSTGQPMYFILCDFQFREASQEHTLRRSGRMKPHISCRQAGPRILAHSSRRGRDSAAAVLLGHNRIFRSSVYKFITRGKNIKSTRYGISLFFSISLSPMLRIRDIYPGSEIFHPGSKRFRIAYPDPQRI